MKSETEVLKGFVVRSSRNIITARVDSKNGCEELECRIKGKVLKTERDIYNPVAPGDWVKIERHKDSKKAMILSVEKRRNFFSRFNQKGNTSQLLAANIDLVLCVCSPSSPPLRPRFLDRVLLQAEIAGIEAAVICNKTDLLDGDMDVDERLEEYSRIGYKLFRISAKTGEGIGNLRSVITGKNCVLTGQSGVGKSSIINALSPGLFIKEGRINDKYDRGVHTTTMSIMFEIECVLQKDDTNFSTRIIDTPGIRRFIPDGIRSEEVIIYMREFASLSGKCSFGLSCSHRSECGCKILEAVNAGVIHEDRYESFLRITDDLRGKENDD